MDGNTYVVIDQDAPIVELPAHVVERLQRKPPRIAPAEAPGKAAGSAYVRAALEREVVAVALAPDGQRNDALNRAAFNLGQLVATGDLERATVAGRLADAARAARLDEAEIGPTIESGLRAGMDAPRAPRAVRVSVADAGQGNGSGHAPSAVEAPVLGSKALHGPLGDIVRAVEPSTEAAPCAILVHLLAAVGMLAGRSRWYNVGATKHHARMFACVVGDTSAARKGTAWQVAKRVLARVTGNQDFGAHLLSGIGSGEGLIDAVRDDVIEQHLKKAGGVPEYVSVPRPGVTDKRLLVVEQEFARVLSIMERQGASLSAVLREAWDGDTLRVRTRSCPLTATDPHVAVIAHITATELRGKLATVDLFNGVANRFTFHAVTRARNLPFGALLEVPEAPVEALQRAIFEPAHEGEFQIEGPARDLWEAAYAAFSVPIPGAVGAVLARREPTALRLALTYAICDDAPAIRLPHLEAALAVIEHATASAQALFGEASGDPMAERVLVALRAAGATGLSRSQVSAELGRNVSKAELDRALFALEGAGRARRERHQGAKGAPAEVWVAR